MPERHFVVEAVREPVGERARTDISAVVEPVQVDQAEGAGTVASARLMQILQIQRGGLAELRSAGRAGAASAVQQRMLVVDDDRRDVSWRRDVECAGSCMTRNVHRCESEELGEDN